MPRKLKVYGWGGLRKEAQNDFNHHGQTREIIAATSMAEVMRLTGLTRTACNHGVCETKNRVELEVAMAEPGVQFWSGRRHFAEVSDYVRVEPKVVNA